MSMESIIGIANSALSAQSERITLIAENLANANSIETSDGGPYQRRIPIFATVPVAGVGSQNALGVKLADVIRDPAPPRAVYDPSNPFADAGGMVKEPTVNPVYEMVDMMEASRSYQANLSMIETARTAIIRTIDLLK
jgi:flagellar basal-body rod protein FlgC